MGRKMQTSELRRILSLAKAALGASRSVGQYLVRGEADATSWRACLDLHCRTNGRSTEILNSVMQKLRPEPAPIRPFDSLLGNFHPERVGAIADQIRRDGYYVFETRVPDAICDEIATAARSIKARVGRDPDGQPRMAAFDPENPVERVYDILETDSWQIPAYQRIIADPVFVNVSQAYLGAASALKQVNLWWSSAIGGAPDKDHDHAAQMFHFDYDPAPRWLKFFVYVTDVTEENGPHTYVRGSHRLRQEKLREIMARGYVRISDPEIAGVFGRDNVVELAGPKGTVLAVDTMGFHKGKPPISGYRLLAQLEYASPLFVQSASNPLPMPSNASPELLATRNAYPWAFKRFPLPA
jgi:hypothetical protein